MKKIGKAIAGVADGALGTELVTILDKNKDGKVTIGEILAFDFKSLKSLTTGQVFRILVSLATTAGTLIALFR